MGGDGTEIGRRRVSQTIMNPSSSDAFSSSVDPTRSPVWSRFLEDCASVFFVVLGPDGAVVAANPALEERAGRPLAGNSLGDVLVEPDAAKVRQALENEEDPGHQPVLLNFVGPRSEPFTLRCWWGREGRMLRLLGELPEGTPGESASALLRLNNELAALSRENLRKSRELEAARQKLAETLRELKESYWHLKKVQEVIPICMKCQRIRSGDKSWDDVAEYFRQNDIFLSHGLCPSCADEYMEEVDGVAPTPSGSGNGSA